MNRLLPLLAVLALGASAAETGLRTLGKAGAPRFDPAEITWPAEPGQAEICLWKDDKYAAISLTIDDNCRPDHDWDWWLGATTPRATSTCCSARRPTSPSG